MLLSLVRDQFSLCGPRCQNGVQVIRKMAFKRITDSDHAFNAALTHLQQLVTTQGRDQSWAGA